MLKKWVKGEITAPHAPMIQKKPLKYIDNFLEMDFDEINNKVNDFDILNQKNLQNTLKLIKISKNRGFTGGNNVAIKYILNSIKTDFIMLLSNDVVVAPDFLDELIKQAVNDPKIGVLGPLVYHYHDSDRIQSAGGEILWRKGEIIQKNRGEIKYQREAEVDSVDYITGCLLMARKEVFLDIGLLKEEYVAYWEDVEWCVRAKKAGYKIVCVPQAQIWHKESITTKKSSGFVEYHYVRNRLWFLREHTSFKDKYIFFLNFIFVQIIYLIFYAVIRQKDLKLLSYYLKGTMDGLFKNP
ncbi:MAG: Putative glycosyltransferase [Methanobacterium sp. 42_16]|nr:MAG: Putative glycosyltransferase [Methanobacterium sp. 42_16]